MSKNIAIKTYTVAKALAYLCISRATFYKRIKRLKITPQRSDELDRRLTIYSATDIERLKKNKEANDAN